MPVSVSEEPRSKFMTVRLTGKVTKADYEQFVPEVDNFIKQHGKIRLLVHMEDFHGWTFGAVWEDIKFDYNHFRDIERLALVGDRQWESAMAAFCRPFTTATIRYFDESKMDEALAWVNREAAVTV